MFSVRPHISSSVKNFLRLLQNRVQATHLFLEGDDLGWGDPGLGDDLGWGGEATRDAQGCGGGPPPLGLLERGNYNIHCMCAKERPHYGTPTL